MAVGRLDRRFSRALGVGLVLPLLLASLGGCNRRTEQFVPLEEEAPPPERPVRIPSLAESRPSFDDVRAFGAPPRGTPAPETARGPADPAAGVSAGTSEGPTLTGTVRLADGASEPGPGVLFVIVRTGAGPPLAVQRLEPSSFPLAFSVGPDDVMIPGRRFEGELTVTARLDRDGNPMTRGAEDLVGAVEQPVEPGASGLEIVLRGSDR